MKKVLLTIISLIFLFNATAQDLTKSRKKSHVTQVYKITDAEARHIFTEQETEIGQPYFHSLIGVYPTDSVYKKRLERGHYVYVSADQEKLTYELESISNVEVHILKNNVDLKFILTDTTGRKIKDAVVLLGKKRIFFSRDLQAYQLKKTKKSGILSVDYQGHVAYFSLDWSGYRWRLKHLPRRIKYNSPLRYVWMPFRDIYRSIRQGYEIGFVANVFDRFRTWENKEHHEYSDKFSGYVAFNKPKYRLGDTVKVKAFITNRKGKPINKALKLRLSKYYSDSKNIGTVSPYRKGSYEYQFVLHDSLNLKLDSHYTLYFEKEEDMDLISGSFKVEDYELSATAYMARSQSKTHRIGEKNAIYVQGKDANDFNLFNANMKLTIVPESISKYHEYPVFVPDTLWTHEQKLDVIGETKIDVPNSIFPPVSMSYRVYIMFLNESNEQHEKTLNIEYLHIKEKINTALVNDSIAISYTVLGDTIRKEGTIQAWSKDGNLIFEEKIRLPNKLKIIPYVYEYYIFVDSLTETVTLDSENASLQCSAYRTKDSVFVNIQNPRGINFWYNIYKKKHQIASGFGNSLSYSISATTKEKYFVSLQYLWGGKTVNEEYDIAFLDKKLKILAIQPSVVYPGEETKIAIKVSAADGSPAKNVDLTAYAYTKKFKRGGKPDLPYFGKIYGGRTVKNNFRNVETDEFLNESTLKYPLWRSPLGLDSMQYYQFIYPEDIIYRTESFRADSITQFAPYVIGAGTIQPIHVIYLDHKPVYFRNTDVLQRYAFRVDSGYHHIKLRTRDRLITIDSLFCNPHKKLIFSVDILSKHRMVQIDTVDTSLSDNEIRVVSKYMLPIVQNFHHQEAYLNQEKNYQLLSRGNYARTGLAGPFSNRMMEFVYKDRFKTYFNFESNFSYQFSEGLLKMKEADRIPRLVGALSDSQDEPLFSDSVLTKQEIEGMWTKTEDIRHYTYEKYDNPSQTTFNHGRLFLDLDQRDVFVKNILLVKNDDRDFMRIYPGRTIHFHQLDSGNYKAVYLFSNGFYGVADSLFAKVNGISYYKTHFQKLHAPDSFSINVSEIIKKNILYESSYVPDERKKEINEVKQLYTDQFHHKDFGGTISGIVTSPEDGSPLPGVNIVVKGTKIGTITNFDGEYELNVPHGVILVFSFIGFTSKEVEIGNSAYVDVEMYEDEKQLSEVVVTALGIQRSKRSLGYSIATVSTSLQGRVAGVQVVGNPGATSRIIIRGNSSISGDNKPLYMIDGVFYEGDDFDMEANNVKEIAVLKGEEATAIYGVRAAGGVIIITTKKGKKTTIKDAVAELAQRGGDQVSSLRDNFSDYAYWNPTLTTDKNGMASFEVTFPDDVTAWKTIVLGMDNKKRTGDTEGIIKSFKPVMGNISVPRFLIKGDAVNIIGKAINYTSDTLSVTTSFGVNDKTFHEKNMLLVNSFIDTLRFSESTLDTVNIKFLLTKEDGYFDGEKREIPIFPLGTKESKGMFMALEGDTTLSLDFNPSLGKVMVYAHANVLDILLNEINHVINYKYLCNEQIASKIKVLLMEKKIRQLLTQEFTHEKDIFKLIRKLEKAQNANGSWGWWENTRGTPWISAHVVEALTKAKAAGYKHDFKLGAFTDYAVMELENDKINKGYKLRLLELLHELKETINIRSYVSEIEKDSTLNFTEQLRLTAIKQKSKLPYQLDSLKKYKKETIFGNVYWGAQSYYLHNGAVPATLQAYKILRAEGGYQQELAKIRNYLLERKSEGYWRNTYESTQILEAILPDVLKGVGKIVPSKIQIEGKTNILINSFPYSGEFDAKKLTIRKKGTMPVYFTAHQQFWNATPKKVNGDFSIKSFFLNNRNDTIGYLKGGEKVKLRIEVMVKKDAEFIMIEVPIPAGCSYGSKSQYRRNNEVHREYFKNMTSIFCQKLNKGKYVYEVELVPRYSGAFHLNPAKVEMMYYPVFYGREEMKRVIIN